MRRVRVTNSTRECTLIQFADMLEQNFQGVDDEDCWTFHDVKKVR